jgi:predicted ribosomally synthesized peptide with SipW-like signal peptide
VTPAGSAFTLFHGPSLAATPSTIVYWVRVSDVTPGVFFLGTAALLLTAVVVFSMLGGRLYALAASRGEPRGGGTVRVMLIVGPLLGSPLAMILCAIAAGTLAFFADVTGIPVGVITAGSVVGAAALAALVLARQARNRQDGHVRLLRASIVAAVLLTVGTVLLYLVTTLTDLQPTYSHLTSATYNGQRYHLAREDALLEHSTLHLYRCDALGLLCQEVDSYGHDATIHGGWLQVDEYIRTATAHTPDGHILFTYTLGDFFAQ